jgi:type III secretion protein T
MLSLTWGQWVLGFSLTMPRLMATLAPLPFFSSAMLTGILRTGVAVSLCLLLVPYVAGQVATVQFTALGFFALIVKEVILGLMIGYPVAAIFWAIEAVGFYIDNQRGSAMASSADPLTGQDSTILGLLYTQGFTVYFMSSGAFLALLGVLYQTYKLWPVADFVPSFGAAGPIFYLDVFDRMLHLVVLLSAPLIVTMFLTEFAIALVSRFAPQLNVFFLAMPIKSAVAMLLLIFYGPILFTDLMNHDGGPLGILRAVQAVLQ